jgi:hypothetical protein
MNKISQHQDSSLQNLWKIGTWVLVIIILVVIWLKTPEHIWQYILLLRIPIIFGSLLFCLPILANTIAAKLLQNLFVMRGRWQLATVLVSSTMAGLMIAFISASLLTHAPERFGIERLMTLSSGYQYLITAVLVSPTWFLTIPLSADLELGKKVVLPGAILGIAGSFLLGWVIKQAQLILESWQEFKQFVADWILFCAKGHPQGYLDAQNQLTEGHSFGFALALIGLLVYVLVIFLYRPTHKQSLGEAPALLYLLLIIWVSTLLLGGATFYADYFRVPIVIFFVMFSGFVYALFKVDHFYKIKDIQSPLQAPNRPEDLVNFSEAIDQRLKHQSQQRTLVVVCASGGGIQAAGWTAQVLKGLQEELSTSFAKAIGLISSVSGGSLGSMYFLDRIDPTLGYPPLDSLAQIFNNATEDSLDAIGWGLAYPDLIRTGFPFLVNKYSDRAQAIEIGWQRRMKNPQATLAQRRQQILQGEIPIHVANATLVEDGRRFLISPMRFIQNSDERKAIDFNGLYPNCDLNVTTVARLSATFPYVTPNARNDRDFDGKNYHIADGGYFDNTGLFTAVEWLDEWLEPSKNLNIDRVLLLQINAFPKPEPQASKGDGGWWTAWIGPLKTLNSVRDSTQFDRNAREVKFLKDRWQDLVEIEQFNIFFPAARFGNSLQKFNQPLSWKLTKVQKNNLRAGWDSLLQDPDSSIQEIKQLWLDRWKMKA